MSIADKLTQIAENEHRVYEAGQQARWNEFWERFQTCKKGGDRTDYNYAFYCPVGTGWGAQNLKPKYDLRPTTANYMFYQFSTGFVASLTAILEQAGVVLDTSQCTSHDHMFFMSPITDAPNIDLTKSTVAEYLFCNCYYLKKAEITLAEDTLTSYNWMFYNCARLEDLTINGTADRSLSLAQSSNLTTDSVQSVINALKDLTGLTTQTITFHATVGGNLTDEQKAAITAKNWTLAY